jgi:hypothetical protein
VDYYNDVVVREGNRQLEGIRGNFHHFRHHYGRQVVAVSTLTAAILSAPYGRFAVVRNAALAGLLTGWVVFPATVSGLLVNFTESLWTTPSLPHTWTRKGEQTVRQTGDWLKKEEEREVGTFSRSGNGRGSF